MRSLKIGPTSGVKLVVLSCMNRWSYSTPADQPGAKPNSRPAPTVGRRHDRVTERGIDGETVAGHGAAALHVEQEAVPGPTDLAGEQSERIDFRGVGEARSREEQAR